MWVHVFFPFETNEIQDKYRNGTKCFSPSVKYMNMLLLSSYVKYMASIYIYIYEKDEIS